MSDRKAEWVAKLFEEYGGSLFRFLKKRLPGYEAEEVAQETYLHLMQCPDIETIRNPSAFLFRTASNLAVDRLRYLKVRTTEEIDLEAEPSRLPDPEEIAQLTFQLERFRAALNELPVLCQHAFLLRYVKGMTYSEIAMHLGIHKRTVERHVFKAFEHCYNHRERFRR